MAQLEYSVEITTGLALDARYQLPLETPSWCYTAPRAEVASYFPLDRFLPSCTENAEVVHTVRRENEEFLLRLVVRPRDGIDAWNLDSLLRRLSPPKRLASGIVSFVLFPKLLNVMAYHLRAYSRPQRRFTGWGVARPRGPWDAERIASARVTRRSDDSPADLLARIRKTPVFNHLPLPIVSFYDP